METEKAIKLYFDLGLNFGDILHCLAQNDGIIISKSTLKRTLKRIGLYRRKHNTDLLQVALFIQEEVEKSGQLHGYKFDLISRNYKIISRIFNLISRNFNLIS